MQPFIVHTGRVAALPRANVDTDQIIPKQFLKRIERTGFGPSLFFDWRYRADGSPDPAFELNRPAARGASVLLAGENFGCGSSREHAPWALADYGFRAILAPSFADIFHGNCCQNGLLPVTLPEKAVHELFRRCEAALDGYDLTVDLMTTVVRDAQGYAVGAAGVAESGDSLPARARAAVSEADAVLLGAVGAPALAAAERGC